MAYTAYDDFLLEAWGYDYDDEEYKETLDKVFTLLCKKGYIWQDKNGNYYKLNDISDKHLLNILNFCKYSYRPKAQVDILKNEAIKRGLIND